MDLLQGEPLPDVKTTTTQTSTAPDYYTNYLSNLAQAGGTAMQMDPTKMVAGFDQLQQQGFGQMGQAATAYQPGLTAATQAATGVAGGLDPSQIQRFLNPYTQNVVQEMERLSNQNVQRNVLPGLKGAFAGSGGYGSRRMFDTTGQTLADIQANLTGQQQKALESGYNTAADIAMRNLGIQQQGAQTLGNLAEMEQSLGMKGAQGLLDAGALKQAYEQAKIEAPLKMATNASGLLRGYQVPLGTTQVFEGPMPGSYGLSPLQAITGLATLFAANRGGTTPAQGVLDAWKGVVGAIDTGSWRDYVPDFLENIFD